MERDLRTAFLNDEFVMHYQPLVNLQSGKISALQALIRWNHPERGTLLPVDFIPFAEETPQILPIGEWALRLACKHAATWPGAIGVTGSTLACVHRLRALGVRIAMDDFGTGHSSLRTLRNCPFDRSKIDECFVHDLLSKPDSRAIIQAVAQMAGSLGLKTTAEGVETEGELDYLKRVGCTEAQGYLFSSCSCRRGPRALGAAIDG
jgi:EAL domain-containing protein (putative c-di-GMP-specific phosphodiesterase class I)